MFYSGMLFTVCNRIPDYWQLELMRSFLHEQQSGGVRLQQLCPAVPVVGL